MRCADCREAISAQLDGEGLPGEAASVEDHLAGCPDCRAYADRAARITRLARTGLAEPAPDLVAAVLAAPAPPARRARAAFAVRVALGGLGLGQAALAVAGIAGAAGHGHGEVQLGGASATHFAHESSAWNLALAVAFLLAATGFSRVAGLVAVVGSFVGVLAVLSVLDLLAGQVEIGRLLGHSLAAAGWCCWPGCACSGAQPGRGRLVLLAGLRLLGADPGGGTGARRSARRGLRRRAADAPPAPWVPRSAGGGDGLAPTAERRPAA
ncbi:hypothetical protein BJF78_25500 [Pseudonocardia sp. CNS-139]|nr:hypothetical protein BJF78_25500 [Pseudonocardia sp. CNS-139]